MAGASEACRHDDVMTQPKNNRKRIRLTRLPHGAFCFPMLQAFCATNIHFGCGHHGLAIAVSRFSNHAGWISIRDSPSPFRRERSRLFW
jgi:hypothetical protein